MPAQPSLRPFTKAANGACCSHVTSGGASATTRQMNHVEVKYSRDTDPKQQDRASQQHQVLREIQKYAPQATVDQVTLTLGVSGRSNLQLIHKSPER
jgi:hypothetical protein